MTTSPAAERPTRSPARRRAPVPERPCGYRRCPDLLPQHDGKGRPEGYHKSARWRQQPGGDWVLDREDGTRNCKQMNDAERQAAKDAGVPGLVDLLDERTEYLDAEL